MNGLNDGRLMDLAFLLINYNFIYVMFSAIWYHVYNLNNVNNTHGGVLLFVKLQAETPPPWEFFTFF